MIFQWANESDQPTNRQYRTKQNNHVPKFLQNLCLLLTPSFLPIDTIAIASPRRGRGQLSLLHSLMYLGHLAALTRSRLIGDHPSGLTKEQTTETMDPCPKTKGLRPYPRQWNLELVGAARLPMYFHSFFAVFSFSNWSTAFSVVHVYL